MNLESAGKAAGIEFRAITKRYGGADAPLIVRGVSFTVPKGTLTTLLGPSGCGKTTLLRMIAGLETPSSGKVFIDGEDVTALGATERNVSMVFQSYALFPHMSVLDNVSYGLNVSGVPRAQAHAQALEVMAQVGLADYGQRMPSELSGGQQQRVAVARSLVLRPSVLLFDEPLSNLDARLRRSMREEIRALQQRFGLTVAYVTHDQGEALAVSDQVIVMDQGLIAQAGPPRAIYEAPANAFVAGFMGEALVLDAQVDADGSLRLGPLRLPLQVGRGAGPIKVAVRPEAWLVESAAAGDAANALPGTLQRCSYLGNVMEMTIATELGELFVTSPDVTTRREAGEAVRLRWSGRGVAVLGAG